MKNHRALQLLTFVIMLLSIFSCGQNDPITKITYDNPDAKAIFLHHSTGHNIWFGDLERGKRSYPEGSICMVPRLIKEYNEENGTKLSVIEQAFPSGKEYAWKNNPYDYFNIWVKNGGNSTFMNEPTLEILTKEYDIIIFKHCFPIGKILEDDGNPDINSEVRTLANYKLQYNALKKKLNEFPDTKFIVWTAAALVESATTPDQAKRTREFQKWVIEEWNVDGDNIEIFDFYELETEGGLYLKPEYANSSSDSHPNLKISAIAAKSFTDKIIEVYELSSK